MKRKIMRDDSFLELFFPDTDARAIALLVHGLNLKPSRMTAIMKQLNSDGVIVINMALTGHRGNYADLIQVTREDWLQDYADAWETIEQLREHNGPLPLYFVGNSLGALTFVDYVTENPQTDFSRAVFLAPALALRWRSMLLKPLARISPRLPIPSASRLVDRMYHRLPVQCYQALYYAFAHVQQKLQKTPLTIPSLIYIHPKDELVSYHGLLKLVEEQHIVNSKLMDLSQLGAAGAGFYHMIVDQETMGTLPWQRFCRDLQSFLRCTTDKAAGVAAKS
ncbi:MAG: alpha/beta hydrolase [Oligoflexus sp.]